jgi:hypothetical protein
MIEHFLEVDLMGNSIKLVRSWQLRLLLGWIGVLGAGFWTQSGHAGVFNLPHFLAPGEFALGVEPELIMKSGASLGVNLRYAQGLTELNNFTGIIGTGGGNRQFRVGGAFTFDFFPDIEKQPGIGVALQGLYVRSPTAGTMEITGIPYIHKNFKTPQLEFEPFFSIPTGLALSDGRYETIINLAFGSLFKHNEHFRSVIEFGVPMNNSYTYLSGGFIYYH